ncbi:hypothetical protein F4778DRAFT_117947 [Xylariomycetidae sp. FL2044]|nr:hypothetical protein F4778DRAFT_117947 [Xylariomycetidae sp. FL2044]
MAQKTSDPGGQSNPSSSSTKDSTDSGAAQKPSNSHASSPAPATQQTKSTGSKESGENDADSYPMTKSTSSGSNPMSKDAMAGPSPYGTRSRNRGARPNYAEDKDVDSDMFDAYHKKDDEPKKSSRQANAAAAAAANGTSDTSKTTTSNSRKRVASEEPKAINSHNAAKDSHPATHTTTTNGNNATASSSGSKKRKAPGQSNANTTHNQSNIPTTSGSIATGTRRSAAQTVVQGRGGYKETNMLSFEKCRSMPKDGKMVADDGTTIERNDHVYLVCEPPGEPYYLGRIMEFLHVDNKPENPVDALRLNWYYRPKDIGKKVNDTRLVFATMHSDISPLPALRGKCQIRHKAEIEDLDAYRKTPDCFWYEKLYERYIQKHYDVIPCFQIVNVPQKVKKVLDERWKYILVEQGRAKELTSAVKSCKRCSGYCGSHDSVDCAVCKQTYHMNCVRPPLLKKPSRGFAWACAPCSRAQERKLEARHTPSLQDAHAEAEEEEYWDEEDDAMDTSGTSPTDGIDDTHQPATAEQLYHASLWPYRYLGQHCKPEDALDYDDRIYPRAGSRIGPKHQAAVLPWYGRPVQLVKPLENKKPGKKDSKQAKEAFAAAEAERIARENGPKWIQDEPAGYVARGEDYPNDDPRNTATCLWKPSETVGASIRDTEVDLYMSNALAKVPPALGLPKESTNCLDVAMITLFDNNFNAEKSLKTLVKKVDKSEFKEPDLSPAEVKKFEEGVAKFGSELYHVTRHVKTVKHSRIVRFYYTWKKSDRGKQIWGNFSGRKGKKEAKKAEDTANKVQLDVSDDHDDSAFDTDKALARKRNFTCKFCSTKSSRQWRRAPNVSTALVTEGGGKNKANAVQYVVALCRRCAELWRRYAIQWEDMEDLAKKVAAAGGRSWKRRVDEELLKELIAANEMMSRTVYTTPTRNPLPPAATPSTAPIPEPSNEAPPPRKKLKTIADKTSSMEKDAEVTNKTDSVVAPPVAVQKKKEKPVEKPAPPPAPELPKPRVLPCAVCHYLGPTDPQSLLCCKECRLTVHRKCYGVIDNRLPGKWTCDTCLNDKNPQVSLEYKCVLCPVDFTKHDFVEPPKNTHKKKTEKEREKERHNLELAQKAAEHYRKKQIDMGKPEDPREPLKRTADNNWVHVTCAVWTPEVKFGKAKALCLSEGVPSIPRARFEEVCKACKQKGGACVACHQCRAPVHVECAHQNGYLLGFEITPVKGSRRDQHNIVTIGGETGAMSAAIWCKEHIPQKTVVHRMHDIVSQPDSPNEDLNALQLYVQHSKQADLGLIGTARKANLANVTTKTSITTLPTGANRRQSTTTVAATTLSNQKSSAENHANSNSIVPQSGDKVCISCGIDVSPKWWTIDKNHETILTNGHEGSLGSEARKFVAQRGYQCHKCKKEDRKPVPHAPKPVEEAPSTELRAPAFEPPLTGPSSHVGPTTLAGPSPLTGPSALAGSSQLAGPSPLAGPPLTTPLLDVTHTSDRIHAFPSPWGNPRPIGPPTAPPPVGTPLHAPTGGNQPSPLPLSAPSHTGPNPMAVPGPPPASLHYPGPSGPFGDWPPRNASQVGSATHPVNSASASAIHHNPLRDLRPPPITSISHPQTSSLQHSLGQSTVNGIPPSSPRRGPPSVHGTSPFVTSYSHTGQSTLHNLTNGGPPPRPSDHSFSHGLLSQRSPFATPHGSPPVSREGIGMSRDSSVNSNNPPSRPNDGRPLSGASASPSLRNLLS